MPTLCAAACYAWRSVRASVNVCVRARACVSVRAWRKQGGRGCRGDPYQLRRGLHCVRALYRFLHFARLFLYPAYTSAFGGGKGGMPAMCAAEGGRTSGAAGGASAAARGCCSAEREMAGLPRGEGGRTGAPSLREIYVSLHSLNSPGEGNPGEAGGHTMGGTLSVRQ